MNNKIICIKPFVSCSSFLFVQFHQQQPRSRISLARSSSYLAGSSTQSIGIQRCFISSLSFSPLSLGYLSSNRLQQSTQTCHRNHNSSHPIDRRIQQRDYSSSSHRQQDRLYSSVATAQQELETDDMSNIQHQQYQHQQHVSPQQDSNIIQQQQQQQQTQEISIVSPQRTTRAGSRRKSSINAGEPNYKASSLSEPSQSISKVKRKRSMESMQNLAQPPQPQPQPIVQSPVSGSLATGVSGLKLKSQDVSNTHIHTQTVVVTKEEEDIFATTFYRRELPSHLVSFTSPEGKDLFKKSLQLGLAEIYFQLAGNFTSQSHPAYCGLGSLAMVLNALEIDPGKKWKGVWRWWSEDVLDCCAPSEVIKTKGISFVEFASLARCQGLMVQAKRGDKVSYEDFVKDLKHASSSTDTHIVVNFSRATMGQTGDGHFSPVAGYYPADGGKFKEDMVLILDVARFKYPSYFAPVRLLYESLKPIDSETNQSRGYFIMNRGRERLSPIPLVKLTSTNMAWSSLAKMFCSVLPNSFLKQPPTSMTEVIERVLTAVPHECQFMLRLEKVGIDLAGNQQGQNQLVREHEKLIGELMAQIRHSQIFRIVSQAFSVYPSLANLLDREKHYDVDISCQGSSVETVSQEEIRDRQMALAAILVISSPKETFENLPHHLHLELEGLRTLSGRSKTCSSKANVDDVVNCGHEHHHHNGIVNEVHGSRCASMRLLTEEVKRINAQLHDIMTTFCKCSGGKEI